MKQVQIKGNMIPKALELIEAKRGGNQPILSFHSTEPNADVYSLYLDDLLDYIENVKKQAGKETAEKFAGMVKAMAYQSTDWSHGEHPMVVEVDYIDEICNDIAEGKV